MDNNDILKKLRVALKYRDDDIQRIVKLAGMNISKSELGAIFRSEDHPKYMKCGDQLLRNFLNGLIIEKRGPMKAKDASKGDKPTKSPFDKKKPKHKKPFSQRVKGGK